MTNLPPSGSPSPYGIPASEVPQRPSGSDSKTLVIVLCAVGVTLLMCGGVLVALLLPAVGAARNAAQRMQRSNHLKQVGLGIHNYHSAYKQLPFTIAANSDGSLRSGWRLGLSPFIEGESQWEMFNEQAGSDALGPLADRAPACLQAIDGQPGETHIFAIVSENSMFPPTPNTTISFRDVVDGLSNTVMGIEISNRTTNWTSNDNLTPAEAYRAIQELQPPAVAHLLMGDGAVIAVTRDLDRAVFDSLVSRDGGEMVDGF